MVQNIPFIDLGAQQALIRADLDHRISKVLDHGQYINGPEVIELETRLATFIGARYCITVANGTDALQIALMAYGIGPGDEVITSPFTFMATGEMIALVGARPVLVDIDPKTYNIDPKLIRAKITKKTKAIMPVSLYGQCCDMDAINAIAAEFKIPVIEDAAQSLGATYKNKQSCNLSEMSCTSFFPSKSLGCYGDGGALFTSDAKLAATLKMLRSHGQEKRYHHKIIGVNSRFDTLQAAVLLSKLDIFGQEIKNREKIGKRYTEKLKGLVETPFVEAHNTSVYAQYTIQVDNRDQVAAQLKKMGVPTAVHYPVPLNLQPALSYLEQGVGQFPVSDKAAARVLSLPMHPYLSQELQDQIIGAVHEVVGKKL